jgi:hypothetical protein
VRMCTVGEDVLPGQRCKYSVRKKFVSAVCVTTRYIGSDKVYIPADNDN